MAETTPDALNLETTREDNRTLPFSSLHNIRLGSRFSGDQEISTTQW